MFKEHHCFYVRFAKLRNKLRALTRSLRSKHEANIAKNIKENPKGFWKYVNSQLKTKVQIDVLIDPDSSTSLLDSDKATTLNNFFSSVFCAEDISDIPTYDRNFVGPFLLEIQVEIEDVRDQLLGLNPGKSVGPDNVHPRVLREAAEYLVVPLTNIFRHSFEIGAFPLDWRSARVVPIYKNGSRHCPSNYRPVSFTSIVIEVFESIIKEFMFNHLKTNELISDMQYGFIPHRSCKSQLLSVLNILYGPLFWRVET